MAIIGAGLGGVATAVKLSRAGLHNFTVFERSPGAGGTWYDNTYPGCAVDVPSHAYSFSFKSYDWSGTHAKQPELRRYVDDVIDEFGLRDRCRFGVGVVSAVWDPAASSYTVTTTEGEVREFDVVVSCTGMLNVPRYPEWPGLEDFDGPRFHTARWEHEHDLTGRRVAFVGTGSTSAQVVPSIADSVGELHVFQRQPGWVVPKKERVYTERERDRYRRFPLLQKLQRYQFFRTYHRLYEAYDATSSTQAEMRALCENHIASTIEDPAVREAVTPHYAYGCKRGVQANNFYQAFNKPQVELHPHEVVAVEGNSIVTADGTRTEVDVLILGTGFQPTNYLSTVEVRGSDGRTLTETWAGEPKAFLGMTVPRFKNFFILFGPNTNGGSIIIQLERQAEVVARTVGRLARRGRPAAVDTKPEALRRYVDWIDRRLAVHSSALESGCTNYYHVASGRNVTQWPGDQYLYWAVTRFLPRLGLRLDTASRPPVHRPAVEKSRRAPSPVPGR
ncbi:NAD(P)/FAD-dependent oxidoreductase [Pseudonocardia ailaonensis]|uniref:NAD(P)/FAD-dependent oxidoreductase n=1 Tax=Pseudonocardia ailaonensis TaxID=367279 RepID=A0ABN2NH10_9PSEU